MKVRGFPVPGPLLVTPARRGDARGFFVELYAEARFAAAGIAERFVQDNLSFSAAAGTVRGLHFQTGPSAQSKLVAAPRGRILDVAVDIRRGSPTYGAHVAAELSAENGAMLYVPKGFAHGFCTLEPDTIALYKVDAPYDPERDAGLAWDDPALGLVWPVDPGSAVLSPKDRAHPRLAELPAYFDWTI